MSNYRYTCGKCGEQGHNRRSCPDEPKVAEIPAFDHKGRVGHRMSSRPTLDLKSHRPYLPSPRPASAAKKAVHKHVSSLVAEASAALALAHIGVTYEGTEYLEMYSDVREALVKVTKYLELAAAYAYERYEAEGRADRACRDQQQAAVQS
jgi:hypothetical protein